MIAMPRIAAAAAVRGLDKFSLYVPWIQQEGKTDRNGNAAKRSAKTKENKLCIPNFNKI